MQYTKPSLPRPLLPVLLLLCSCGGSQPARLGRSLSIIAFGARGDAVSGNDGIAVAGSTTFTSQSANFSSEDTGKFIEITGAGSNAGMLHGAGTANGVLATTIQSVSGTHTVALANAAAFAGANLSFVYGTDNTQGFRNAYESGKPLFVPAGNFLIVAGTQTVPATILGTLPLIITGTGPSSRLLSDNPIFSIAGETSGTSVTNLDLEPIASFTVVPVTSTAPHPGTPILVDIFGTGNGVQPAVNTMAPKYPAFWSKLSAFQQAQILGPTITIQGGDHVNVSHITGNQVTIHLQDVASSSLENNDFLGGYGGNADESTGGIEGCLGISTLASFGQFTNVSDTIRGNNIRYCSLSNIYWAKADRLLVRDNISEYSGESGYKNFQSSFNYPSHNLTIINNFADHSLYDGFDLSADFPHKATFPMYSTVTGNTSQNNQNTGFWSDGTNWTFTANSASSNGIEGFFLDYSGSLISGNTSLNNNLNSTTSPDGDNQFTVGGCCSTSNDVIENNVINLTIAGITGDAMWVGSSNVTAINNIVHELPGEGGLWFRFPPTSSSNLSGIKKVLGASQPAGSMALGETQSSSREAAQECSPRRKPWGFVD